VIHDLNTDAGQQASADQTPLVNREGVAEVPLTGIFLKRRIGEEIPDHMVRHKATFLDLDGWRSVAGAACGRLVMRAITVVPVLAALFPAAVRGELTVSTDFEGGSAVVDAIDAAAHEIIVRPAGDPARGWPCWWYLRIDGLPSGQTATLVVRGSTRHARNNGRDTEKPLSSNWALPSQAAVSDDGVTWRHTEPGVRQAGQVSYLVTGTGGPIWLAWGPPFTSRDVDELFEQAVARRPEHARVFELARSREGRAVRGLRVTTTNAEPLPAVWIQARQHAWESGSSWVARGLVEWLLADEPDAVWLRTHGDVTVIPVMDVDRVATGDGGKESEPHDHNRDWSPTPLYPEVAAAQQRLQELARERRLAIFLDLHNPGPNDLRPFFFVGPADRLPDAARANRDRFLMFASRRLDGPLALDSTPRVTGTTYHPLWRQISGVWVSEHTDTDAVAACLETAWNTPHGTAAGYRGVGAKLGQAVADYLRLHRSEGP